MSRFSGAGINLRALRFTKYLTSRCYDLWARSFYLCCKISVICKKQSISSNFSEVKLNLLVVTCPISIVKWLSPIHAQVIGVFLDKMVCPASAYAILREHRTRLSQKDGIDMLAWYSLLTVLLN